MKTLFSIALGASLLVNLFLLFVLTRGGSSTEIELTSSPANHAAQAHTSAAAGSKIDASIWPTLETADLRVLNERLRTNGFPPDIARAIVRAQVDELFAARRRALDPDADARPFWKNATRDPRVVAAERDLRREQMQMLRDLLGTDPEEENPYTRAREKQQFGHLPAEKIAELREIVRAANERRSELFNTSGMLASSDREKVAAIEREQREAIRAVLTPEEFLEYELRASSTANSLRFELSAFDPTEEEFRKIFPLRQAFEEKYNPMAFSPGTSQEEMRRRSEAEREVREQIKAALGPERGAAYERTSDFNYRRTSQLVARLELPAETTDQLFAVQKEFEQRRLATLRGLRSREEMTQHMTALQAEALEKITPILRTSHAIEAYKQYGGSWLANMVPRAAPRD